MPSVHAAIANAVIMFFALLGLWGIGLGVTNRPLNGSYRAALVLAEGVAVVQVLVGLLLLPLGLAPRDDLHYLYGASLLVTLPLVQQFLAGKHLRAPLAFGLGCLFMMGLAIRAITTGR